MKSYLTKSFTKRLQIFLLALILSCLCSPSIFADTIVDQDKKQENQQQEIKGSITNISGEILAGVFVHIKEKNQGEPSDSEGKYNIKASIGDTLQFSLIGYKDMEVIIHKNLINIQMEKSQH